MRSISAPSDLSSPSQLHSLLLSLRHIRLSKIRHALRPSSNSSTSSAPDTGNFSGAGDYLQLTGLTPIEVMEMKRFLGGVMGVMRGLRYEGEEGEGDGGDVRMD